MGPAALAATQVATLKFMDLKLCQLPAVIFFFFKLHNVEHYSNSIFHFQVVGGLTHVVAPI